MIILGIALIVIGLALVCGGLISRSRTSGTEEEEKTEPRTEEKPERGGASKTGQEAKPVSAPATLTDAGIDSGMAELLRRFDEIDY